MLLRQRSNWVVPIASISIALEDHQAIQRKHDQEEPNRNTKIP